MSTTQEATELNEHAITDLVLYALNTREFYDHSEGVRKNFAVKIFNGVYSEAIAIDFIAKKWVRFAEVLYSKEFSCHFSLTNKERLIAAKDIINHWMDEIYEIVDDIKAGLRDKRGNLKQ